MLWKPKECVGCVLHNPDLESRKVTDKYEYERKLAGRGFMQPEGRGSANVLVMLESLGDNEVTDGLPVRPHAPAGAMFQRCIDRSPGLSRDMFRISNTIYCQPPFNNLEASWGPGAISHCGVHRRRVLEEKLDGGPRDKRVILALGAVPFKALTGWEGAYKSLTDVRGYPIDTQYGTVIGSYHPSHIQQGAQKLMGVLMLDMRKAVHLAQKGFTRRPVTYIEHPSYFDAVSFLQRAKDSPQLPLAFDIETPWLEGQKKATSINSIQFSLGECEGIYLDWQQPFIDIARELLALPNIKLTMNGWGFDCPTLREIGGCTINGIIEDVQWMFHHYQPDLTTEGKEDDDAGISSRLGLQYIASFFNHDFPWKHWKFDKSLERKYGCVDVDVLHRIYLRLPTAMKNLGVWKGYEDLRRGLRPCLDNMSLRGMPVHEPSRQALELEVASDMQQHFNEMQKIVPLELHNIEPKGGYKRGWQAVKEKDGRIRNNSDGSWNWFDDDTGTWQPLQDVRVGDVVLPARIKPFKPSKDQIVKYLKHKGITPPSKKVKDIRGKTDTTEQKELIKLYRKTKDPLLDYVLKYRDCETTLTRYVQGWKPDTYGYVHPEFGYIPASGQLSCYDPNAQQLSKNVKKEGIDKKYVTRLRGMIKALPGHTFLEFDLKAAHAQTSGFESQDVDYLRLAKLDVHSFLTAHFLNYSKILPSSQLPDLSWSNDHLRLYLEDIRSRYKDVRNLKAKPAAHGYNFGMGPNKLYTMNEETMTLREAKAIMKMMDELFPRMKKWRTFIKNKADDKGYLVSRYGFVRWFWDVYSRKRIKDALPPFDWDVRNGSDAEDAIAFLPANDAHGYIQACMVEMELTGLNEKYKLINMIHDALLFMCPNVYLDEAKQNIKHILERPSNILVDPVIAPLGLSIEVDLQEGRDWSQMVEIK